ncbi:MULTISPECIES: HepT-like ribonuclease domain-containing protein [unclassified Methanoculleus]|uniref:HepT-like ribonuclease domain-containing protein n=1 Tax=unclassified Methanoculleus TaxID=2619537 RepID=UPI0037431C3F
MLRREPPLREKISDAPLIIAFRNRLIHGYATVSDEVIRGVVEGYLPVLAGEVRSLLRENGYGCPRRLFSRLYNRNSSQKDL